ncbi:MAG: hypothetical protein LQ352_001284 [Teloschistes flavicans]|nr:MAG: hypothetical protein LQ352_001284 [Teloschistes flavicans]
MNSPSLTDLSSDLSSVGSLSPPPPSDYPSPPSSQNFASEDPEILQTCLKRPGAFDGPEPAKKRRRSEPKPRTTQLLHLPCQPGPQLFHQAAQLDTLSKLLRQRKKIVVIAGAGISVSAGIPDFRSASGLFTTLKNEHNLKASGKQLFDASVYQTDSATTSFHSMMRNLSHLVSQAKPTAFHHLLATLGEEGRLMRLYTQNVDCIDTSLAPLATSVPLAAKGPWPRTVQLHGGLEKMVCSKCNHLSDFQPALFDGPLAPLCTQCVETDKIRTDHAGKRSHGIGRLRPRIVLYNEHNPDDEAIGTVVSSDLRSRPDAVIVVGTSLKIPGVRRIVREMCGVVRSRRNGIAVWVNHDPPPIGKEFEDCWDLVVKGSSDDVAAFANMRHWDEDGTSLKNCTESEAERAVQDQGVQVVIQASQKLSAFAIPTPAASPAPKPTHPLSKLGLSQLHRVEIPKKALGPSTTDVQEKQPVGAGSNPKSKIPKTKKPKLMSDTSDNGKINSHFKIRKPRQTSTDDLKRKVSLLDKYQKHFCSTEPPSSHGDQNCGPLTLQPPDAMFLGPQIWRGITPQDLELRGPTPVVRHLERVQTNHEQSTTSGYAKRCVSPDHSPPGRLPTGMADLLHHEA